VAVRQQRVRGDPGGKVLTLPALFDEYWEELEADFHREYALDLTGVWTGALSLRKVSVLVAELPPGCLTRRAQGGDGSISDEASWLRRIEYNLRALADEHARPVELPAPGWRAAVRRQAEKSTVKAERWMARNRSRTTTEGGPGGL
jgi:hypothetical protein